MLKILYRISDGSHPKSKLPHADKFHCLQNCISIFGKDDFYVFADNCKLHTMHRLNNLNLQKVVPTSLGNAASWRYVTEYAIEHFQPNDIVYLLEDDYLHLPDARQVLLEGIEIADYVSLYDHPDKYIEAKREGNPLIKKGGEKTKVLLTTSSHWKYTNSTTMSFAVRVKTLAEDKGVWWENTAQKTPRDFKAFAQLCGHSSFKNQLMGKKRKIATPIPGRATHIELKFLAPLVDWSKI